MNSLYLVLYSKSGIDVAHALKVVVALLGVKLVAVGVAFQHRGLIVEWDPKTTNHPHLSSGLTDRRSLLAEQDPFLPELIPELLENVVGRALDLALLCPLLHPLEYEDYSFLGGCGHEVLNLEDHLREG